MFLQHIPLVVEEMAHQWPRSGESFPSHRADTDGGPITDNGGEGTATEDAPSTGTQSPDEGRIGDGDEDGDGDGDRGKDKGKGNGKGNGTGTRFTIVDLPDGRRSGGDGDGGTGPGHDTSHGHGASPDGEWEAHGWHRAGSAVWRREGEDFAFYWPAVGLAITVERVREDHGEVYAECVASIVTAATGDGGETATTGTGDGRHLLPGVLDGERVRREMGHLHTWRHNLWSSRSHGDVARHLTAAYPPVTGRLASHGLDWMAVLEVMRTVTIREWRRPPEPIALASVADAAPQRWLLKEFLVRGETNLLVGDRASGKSTVAVLAALAVASGRSIARRLVPSECRPVLILDWETTAGEWTERLRSMARAGLGLPDIPRSIWYLRMTRPYAEQAREVQRLVVRNGIGLVIVDSALFAVSGDPKEVPGPRDFMNAVASLGPEVTRLVLIHTTKEEGRDQRKSARAYGTTLWEAGARCIWEVRASADANDYLGFADPGEAGHGVVSVLDIGLVHSKISRGRLRRPFGLRVFYDERELPVDVHELPVTDMPVLYDRLSLTARVLAALRGGPRLVHDIAEEAGEQTGKVEAVLKRLHATGQVLCSTDLPLERRPQGPVQWFLRGA